MVGGFSVFLVALVANDPWVYSVSFFIGGLIIATENFLIHLAGIFKANDKDVAEITKDYYRLAKMTGSEVEEKIEKEAVMVLAERREVKATKSDQRAKEEQKRIKTTVERFKEAEQKIMGILRKYIDQATGSFILKENVRIEGENYVKVFDAVIMRPQTGRIHTGIEVKFFDHYKIDRIKDFLNQTPAYNAYNVLFVLIFESVLSYEQAREIIEFKAELIRNNLGVAISIYSLTKEDELIEVDQTDLDMLFPDWHRQKMDLYRRRLVTKKNKEQA